MPVGAFGKLCLPGSALRMAFFTRCSCRQATGDVSALRGRRDRPDRAPLPLPRLASGPGNLGRAFGVDLDLDGADLTDGGSLWLEAGERVGVSIVRGPRIGVAYAGAGWADLPRRFGIRGHPALSRPFPVDG